MKPTILVGLLVASITVGPSAGAQRFGATVTIDEPAQSDQYVAGRIVRIDAPIDGDLVVAGQRLIIDASVGGDLIAAGESVDIRETVADDVRAAGRTVRLARPVAGHIVAAGETVTLEQGSSVGEWAWLAGRTVSIAGDVRQELRAAGETVSLSSRVEGDANLIGQRIEVAPTAFISGDLIVQSRVEPDISNQATIVGEIIREDLPDDAGQFGPVRWLSGAAGFVYFAATLITAVLVTALLFPSFSGATADRLTATPLRAIGTGLLAAIGTPVLVVAIFMTGIGLIVGLGLIGAYILMLLLASLLGVIAVGRLGLRLTRQESGPRQAKTLLALAIATLVVLLVLQVPVLGGLVMLGLMLAGLGAASTELWSRYREPA